MGCFRLIVRSITQYFLFENILIEEQQGNAKTLVAAPIGASSLLASPFSATCALSCIYVNNLLRLPTIFTHSIATRGIASLRMSLYQYSRPSHLSLVPSNCQQRRRIYSTTSTTSTLKASLSMRWHPHRQAASSCLLS